MNTDRFTAVIIGATGLTGSYLLDLLLKDARYGKVITLSRKQIPLQHPHLEQYLVDLMDPTSYNEVLKGDHLFICTGTTQAKTPDPKDYYRIEHDLPVVVAKTAKENGMKKVIVISAMGASPDSRFMYNRGKGEMERDIEELHFAENYFVQPALIGGDRDEKRPFESAWKKFQQFVDPIMVGFLKKYRIIHPRVIAQSMIIVALQGYESTRIESDLLKELAATYQQ